MSIPPKGCIDKFHDCGCPFTGEDLFPGNPGIKIQEQEEK
jgi:hypothetical protein